MTSNITDFLIKRRSTAKLSDPAPIKTDVKKIIQCAMSVPDHGGLRPYRFVVIDGDTRRLFAKAMVASTIAEKGDVTPAIEKKIEAKAFLAPMQIAIIFNPKIDCKIPEWEQFATASCTGYAITIAASSLGYESIWKSFGYSSAMPIIEFLKMNPREKFLGWINLGSRCPNPLLARQLPDTSKYCTYLGDETSI